MRSEKDMQAAAQISGERSLVPVIAQISEAQTDNAHKDLNVCLSNLPHIEARFADLEARVARLERGRSGTSEDTGL